MKRVLAGLALAALGAQGPTLAQEKPPVFAAEAALVAVDVSVVDGRGRPVADLLPEDFELSVDGQPRAIASLEFVRLGRRPGAPPPPPPPEVLGYATNEGVARGRLVLLAIDQGSLRAGLIRDVTLAADRLLDRLTPEDRVGLLAFPPPGPSVEPTADHVAVRNALGRVVGTFSARLTHLGLVEALALEDDPLRWQMVLERECPLNLPEREREICVALISEEALAFATEYRRLAEASRRTLQSLFATLAGLDGPKTVVLVSQGLHVESAGALQELARAAAAARVSLFVLRLERHGVDASVARPSATPLEDQMHGAWGLEALAGLARGTTFTVGAGAEGIFERVADEISGYYLLGFEPAPDERDDREHEIQVAVRRRGVSLRSRRSVRIDSRPAAPDPAQALTSTLGSPFAIPDVPFRAAAFALPGSAAETVRVLLAVERVEDAAPGGLVGVAVLDARGRLVSSGQRPLEGPRALLAAEVPAGTYTLRVALVDGRGRRGSLAWAFDARLHGGPEVAIGDLMLVPREQGTPAIIPEAGRDAALSAVVELAARDGRPVEGLAVSFEVADDEEAPALLSVEATLEKASGDRGWFAEAPVGAGVLPPGDYLARAVVTRDGRLLGRATRALRVAGGLTGAEAIGARPIRAAELRGLLPNFDRADALEPGLLAYVLDRVEARSGASVPPAIARARPHARAGRFDAVAEELREVTAASPETSMLRGLQLLAAGDPRGAEGQFKQAVAQDSELVVAAVHIGACEAALGRDQQAIGAWQTALITEPEIPVLRRLLADALLRVDQAAEAVGVLDEELQARPDASVERRRALALAVSGRRQEALPLLDAALDRDPDDLAALYLSLRLAFDAYAQGGGDDPFSRDPERMARYARAYVAAQGPQQQVVARWLRFLEERK